METLDSLFEPTRNLVNSVFAVALILFASCGFAYVAPVRGADADPNEVPQGQSAAGLTVAEIAERVADRVKKRNTFPVEYGIDLQLEGLLALGDAVGRKDNLRFVQQVMRDRGMPAHHVHPYQKQWFVNLAFELYERTKNPAYVGPFIEQTRKYRAEVPRAFDGVIAFPAVKEPTAVKMGDALIYFDPALTPALIDQAQEYVSRMAKAGALSGDATFYDEAIQQLRLLHASLHDPISGLWGHGRGWYATARTVTSTKWSRANGWLLRGLVETLMYLPTDSAYARETSAMLTELAQALIKYQDADGLWHQVVDRPESFAETSGTGLVCYYLARAVSQQLLPEQPYRQASKRAFEGLARHKVSHDGIVYGTAQMNPPLPTAEDYMRWSTPIDDPHGVAAVLLCAAGQLNPATKAKARVTR